MWRISNTILLTMIAVILFLIPRFSRAENEKLVLSEDLHLLRLSEQVWMHTSFIDYPGYGRISANGLVVVDGTAAALIDTPWTDEQTGRLFDGVQERLNATIEHVIVGHSHDDCMGGLAEAHRRNARSYGLDFTKRWRKKTASRCLKQHSPIL